MWGYDYPYSSNVDLGLFCFSKLLFVALCRPGSLPFPSAIITAIKANAESRNTEQQVHLHRGNIFST